MLNSHRHTRMPASAISAATTAVAAPPDHSCLASTLRPEELLRSEGGSSGLNMGVVIGSPYADPLISPGHTVILSRLIPASRATRAARAPRPASNQHAARSHCSLQRFYRCHVRPVRFAARLSGLASPPGPQAASRGDATQSALVGRVTAAPVWGGTLSKRRVESSQAGPLAVMKGVFAGHVCGRSLLTAGPGGAW